MAPAKRQGLTVRVPGGRAALRTSSPATLGVAGERELWSTFGYETVRLLWGLPLKAVQALPDAERRRLAKVSLYIDRLPATEKDSLLREMKSESPTKRLARFRRLARIRTRSEGHDHVESR